MLRASVLVLSLLLFAGCGGNGGGGTGSKGPKRLTRQQYAAKADAICGRYSRLTRSLGHPKSLTGLAKAFDRALPLLEGELAELQRLKPPKGEQHMVDRWLAQSQVLKHDLLELRNAAKAKNRKGVENAFARASVNGRQANRLAARLGMKVCGSS